jgi:hypothetical protein
MGVLGIWAVSHEPGAPVVFGADFAECLGTVIPTTIYHEFSGSIKITTHLDHVSHRETTSGTNWWNRWTYLVFIIHDRRA